jgi:hypothetical protein
MVKKSGTGFAGLTTDSVMVALYGTTPTPNKSDTLANQGYNAGQWVTANQVTHANWPAVGLALSNKTATVSAGVIKFDADDLSNTTAATLAAVFGCLVYDDAITAGTVADQGISYHYFGGSQSVTAGTFTIVWNASGIFDITV